MTSALHRADGGERVQVLVIDGVCGGGVCGCGVCGDGCGASNASWCTIPHFDG